MPPCCLSPRCDLLSRDPALWSGYGAGAEDLGWHNVGGDGPISPATPACPETDVRGVNIRMHPVGGGEPEPKSLMLTDTPLNSSL